MSGQNTKLFFNSPYLEFRMCVRMQNLNVQERLIVHFRSSRFIIKNHSKSEHICDRNSSA